MDINTVIEIKFDKEGNNKEIIKMLWRNINVTPGHERPSQC